MSPKKTAKPPERRMIDEHVELLGTLLITSTNGVKALFNIKAQQSDGVVIDEQDQAINTLANTYWQALLEIARLRRQLEFHRGKDANDKSNSNHPDDPILPDRSQR